MTTPHFSTKLNDRQLMALWNEYCDHISASDHIYFNDEDAFELFGFTIGQTLRAVKAEQYDWDDAYIQMDGYGNPYSFNDLRDEIDMAELEEYLYENEKI